MVLIFFYKQFKKANNSTAIPTGESKTFNACYLKEDTSILSPTITISDSSDDLLQYNYCYVANFDRYYFVNNWTFSGGLWCASCEVDVMATYKDEIGVSERFIARSETLFNDKLIPEQPPVVSISFARSNSINFIKTFGGGSYILGVNNNDSNMHLSYYVLSAAQLESFRSALWSTDFTEILLKWENPLQYITACFWLPLTPAEISEDVGLTTRTGKIKFLDGEIDLSSECYKLVGGVDNVLSIGGVFTIPKHPQAASLGQWLNHNEYTHYSLHFGPFGEMPLDSVHLLDTNEVSYNVQIDLTNGDSILSLYREEINGDKSLLLRRNINMGVNIPLTQAERDWIGVVNGTIDTIAGAVGKNFRQVADGIVDVAQSWQPTVKTVGSLGGILQYYNPCYIQAEFALVLEPQMLSRPLYHHSIISALSGYIVCENGWTNIRGTMTEAERVNQYMKEGFYYE